MYTVYSKLQCPNCDKAKLLLTTNGIEFNVVMIVANVTDPEKEISREDFMSKYPGIRVAPYVVHSNGNTYKTYGELELVVGQTSTS